MAEASLLFRSAGELIALQREGRASAVQIVQAQIAQIRRWNDQIQAVVSLREAEALQEAEAADRARREGRPCGPLHGIALTLKDSLRVRGVSSTYGGLPGYGRRPPRSDATVAARLREAGAIFLGRTNLPLMALDWQCYNPFLPECVNPWDQARTPGGSSGGSAAALAAGFTPLELGSDLGGSIRYPAHCCGVLGLRTTVGLLPVDDMGPEGLPMTLRHLLSMGPMARSLPDLGLMLDVLAGPQAPLVAPAHLRAERLRVAVTPSLPGSAPSAATAAHLESLCAKLRGDGHGVEVAAPDVDLEEAWRIWGAIAGHEYWSGLPRPLSNALTRYLFDAYMLRYKLGEGPFRRWFSAGLRSRRGEYEAALRRHEEILRIVDGFFERYALWLLPVAMGEAIPRQRGGAPIQVEGRAVPYSQYLGAYTVPTTAFQTPVLTAPIGLAPSGMPIGVQVHGPRFADRQLIATVERVLGPQLSVAIPPAMRP